MIDQLDHPEARIGRRSSALLGHRNHLGLRSQDLPADGELWGNLPKTYSMVGLIDSAMRPGKTWEKAD